MRLIASMFAGLVLAGCAPSAPDEKAVTEAVIAANAAKDEAMIARDAAALGAFYTDDYSIIDDKAGIHDKKDQVEFMTQQVELLEARSDEVRVTMLAPDAALVTGRLAGRYRMDGKEADFTERYTGVWVREGGTWRVRHEHGSLVPEEA